MELSTKQQQNRFIPSAITSIGVSTLASWYMKQLQTNPMGTKCLTSGALSGLSDLICQVVGNFMSQRNKKKSTKENFADTWNEVMNTYLSDDKNNTNSTMRGLFSNLHGDSALRQALIGYFVRAPLAHYWFKVLDLIFKSWAPDSMKTAIVKVICEQCIYGPLINLINYWVTGLAEQRSPREIRQMIRDSFWNVWRANVVVWSCVGLVTYRFVPQDLRLLFCNVVALFWGAYVISKTSSAHAAKSIEAPQQTTKQDQQLDSTSTGSTSE